MIFNKNGCRRRPVDETLAAHQILLNSKPPAATTVKAMRDWFLGLNSGKAAPVPQLFDSSKKRFDDVNDLVALRVSAGQDRLSEFILNHFGPFFKVGPCPIPLQNAGSL